jgi:hypothetical protein
MTQSGRDYRGIIRAVQPLSGAMLRYKPNSFVFLIVKTQDMVEALLMTTK